MSSRRRFLQQASSAGLALSATSVFGRFLSAQSPASADQTARIFMNSRRTIASLDRNHWSRRLRRDPRHFAIDEFVEHQIADAQHRLTDHGTRKRVEIEHLNFRLLLRD